MSNRGRQGILPFRIERSDEPLLARGGLVLPYEMARALSMGATEYLVKPARAAGLVASAAALKLY